jgi:hypothetical protein
MGKNSENWVNSYIGRCHGNQRYIGIFFTKYKHVDQRSKHVQSIKKIDILKSATTSLIFIQMVS